MTGPALTRDAWHLRANLPVAAYLLAAVMAAVGRAALPDADWLLVHLLLLGAATNAIVVWSAHFTQTLLRLPADTGRRALTARLIVLNGGIVLVLAGRYWWGAGLVAAAAAWHVVALMAQTRAALPARFGPLVRFYLASGACLVVGALLGAVMGGLPEDDPLIPQLLTSHMVLNVLGWIGLTVAGTLVTLWPTILRTRMAEGAERAARRALPVLVSAVAVGAAGAAAGLRWVAVVGLLGYGVGWALLAWPHLRGWRRPTSDYVSWFAAGSVIAALGWLMLGLLTAIVLLAAGPDWAAVADRLDLLLVPFAVGFGAQVLLGALTYLIPSVLGGGPHAVRGTIRVLETLGRPRLIGANLGMVMAAPVLPDGVRLAGGALMVVCMGAFLPIAAAAVLRNRRDRAVPLDQRQSPTG